MIVMVPRVLDHTLWKLTLHHPHDPSHPPSISNFLLVKLQHRFCTNTVHAGLLDSRLLYCMQNPRLSAFCLKRGRDTVEVASNQRALQALAWNTVRTFWQRTES